MFCVNEASACGVLVDERRVTEERGGLVTVLTLAVRELLGGFQDRALERRVNEALDGMSNLRKTVSVGELRRTTRELDPRACKDCAWPAKTGFIASNA